MFLLEMDKHQERAAKVRGINVLTIVYDKYKVIGQIKMEKLCILP